jgi:hypothetical protein
MGPTSRLTRPAPGGIPVAQDDGDSLDVERRTLEGLATLVPLQTKTPDQFLL